VQFQNDSHPNLTDCIQIRSDLLLFSELFNYKELDVVKEDNAVVSFPKLEAIREVAEGMLSKAYSSVKQEDTKKKPQKGVVENEKSVTEILIEPYFKSIQHEYKRKINHLYNRTKSELNMIITL